MSPLKDRKADSIRIMSKHPGNVPVICENYRGHETGYKPKFIVPRSTQIKNLIHSLRSRIKMSSKEALFLFCNEKLLNGGMNIGELYDMYGNVDGFLYISYGIENTFG